MSNQEVIATEQKRSNERRQRILIVDDNEAVLTLLCIALEHSDFEVEKASNVTDAIRLITNSKFDALLSDLHMPEAGDGLTVVSAMRHYHPTAVTMIFSGFPEMKEAAAAILLQADEILVKPLALDALVDTIKERLRLGVKSSRVVESIGVILERETSSTISQWLNRVNQDSAVITVKLNDADRTAFLPELFRNLVYRLKNPLPLGTRASKSSAASEHGLLRREQGYTAAMMVEESRMLQVSIFQTLENNLNNVDFSVLLIGVMAIADEVDSQLAQAMSAYVAESKVDALPVHS